MHPISVIAHNIRSAHNVGSILRTADSAGLKHVYLTGFTPSPQHRGVRKTALGAENSVPWSAHEDVQDVLATLREDGITVAALELADESQPIKGFAPSSFPVALLLGNEVQGVPNDLLKASDIVLSLPQYGKKDSLNVSVAFGIAAYTLVRAFRNHLPITDY